MNVDSEKRNRNYIVRIHEKRVDAANAGELKAYLAGLVEAGAKGLGVDMRSLEFLDSSGLGALVSAKKGLGKEGKVVLWGLAESVKTLFELTQLNKVFEILDDEGDALSRLG